MKALRVTLVNEYTMTLVYVLTLASFLVASVRADCLLVGCNVTTEFPDCDTCGADFAFPALSAGIWTCQNFTGSPRCELEPSSVTLGMATNCASPFVECCRPDKLRPDIETESEDPLGIELTSCGSRKCQLPVDCSNFGFCEYDNETATYDGCCDLDDDCPPYSAPDGFNTPVSVYKATCERRRCNGDGNCVYFFEPGCCTSDANCVAISAPCVISECNLELNQCIRTIDLNCPCTNNADCFLTDILSCASSFCADDSRCKVTPVATGNGVPPEGCCNEEFLNDASQCIAVQNPCKELLGCSSQIMFGPPVPPPGVQQILAPTFVCDYNKIVDGSCCEEDLDCEFSPGLSDPCFTGDCSLDNNLCQFNQLPGQCCRSDIGCPVNPSNLCETNLCKTDMIPGEFFTCQFVPVAGCSAPGYPVPDVMIDTPTASQCTWNCDTFPAPDINRNLLVGDGVEVRNVDVNNAVLYAWSPRILVSVDPTQIIVSDVSLTVVATSRAIALPQLQTVGGLVTSMAGEYEQNFTFSGSAKFYPMYPDDYIQFKYEVRLSGNSPIGSAFVALHLRQFFVCQPHFYGEPGCSGSMDNNKLVYTGDIVGPQFEYNLGVTGSGVACDDICVGLVFTPPPTPLAPTLNPVPTFPPAPTQQPTPPTPMPTFIELPPSPASPTPPLPASIVCCNEDLACVIIPPETCSNSNSNSVGFFLSNSCVGACPINGEIGVFAWVDLNGNGRWDAEEGFYPVQN